ncbi:hypothetical protein [Fulvivirga lutea]|uniref:Uncharacterized protein n=1 Tax=Fulvivirga lutea TaxID=2810512 RepID=A0A975A1V2_9BACT|nr:hypothetical protein [Fulvivirga lutea]QSE98231.1 hypothetical protein JR347_03895 [Fulvivirga lutea]
MYLLIGIVSAVLVLQIVLFFMIRAKKKEERENNVLLKYDINSPADAFKKMNDMSIPEEDRLKIEELYQGKES